MRFNKTRIDANGLLVVRHGLLKLVLLVQDGAQVMVGLHVIRPQRDGLAVAAGRRIEVALASLDVSKIEISRRQAGVELEGLLVGGDGLLQLPLLGQGASQVAKAFGVRPKPDRTLKMGDGIVKLALLLGDYSQQVVRLGVSGIGRDYLAVKRLCTAEGCRHGDDTSLRSASDSC